MVFEEPRPHGPRTEPISEHLSRSRARTSSSTSREEGKTMLEELRRLLRWGSGAMAVALAVAGCGGGGSAGDAAGSATTAQANPVAAFAMAQQSVVGGPGAPASVAALAPGNLVSNGSFESGTTGWINYGNASVVAGQASSGTSALSVGTAAGGVGQEVGGIVPGVTYRLVAQVKVSTASETAYVGVNFIDVSGASLTQNSVVVASTAYTTASLDVVAPPNAARALVYVWKNAGSGLAYADDFAFAATDPAPSRVASSGNLLRNGSFDIAGLETAWQPFGNLQIRSPDSAVGPYAAQVGTGAGGTGQDVRGIVPGTTYRVSAQAKVGTPDEIGYVGVMFEDDSGAGLLGQNVVIRSRTYTTVQVDATAPANATRALVFVWKNAGPSYAYLDEVSFTQLTPGTPPPPPPPPPSGGPEVPAPNGNVTPLLVAGGYMLWDQQTSSPIVRDAIVTTTMQRYAPDGSAVGTPVSVTTPRGATSVTMVPLTGGGYAATWLTIAGVEGSGLSEVWTQAFSATGTGIGSPVSLGTVNPGAAGGGYSIPRISPLADGGYVMAWTSQQSVGSTVPDRSVYAQRFAADGLRVGGVLQATTEGMGPLSVTGLATGGFLVSWGDLSGIHGGARAYSASGEPLAPAQDAGPTSPGGPFPAYAPLAGGGAVIVWDVVSESLHEQPITAAGLASPAQRVDDTSTPLPAAIPAVAGLPGGGYVVAWNDIPARNVYARRYAADGTPVSPPVRVNLSAGTTANVAVVALSDGRFVVSWIGASGTRIERTFPADGLTTP
jgi:hypothetical protein